jgi:hypothetical protein
MDHSRQIRRLMEEKQKARQKRENALDPEIERRVDRRMWLHVSQEYYLLFVMVLGGCLTTGFDLFHLKPAFTSFVFSVGVTLVVFGLQQRETPEGRRLEELEREIMRNGETYRIKKKKERATNARRGSPQK